MKLTLIDSIIIILYFFLILYLGFKAKRKNTTDADENFLLAGRKLTLPFFVASLVATWYGNILGIGEFVYSSGIVAWICFGFPYYIAAFIFANLFATKIRKLGFKSIPEQVTSKFGNTSGYLSSIIVLIITIPASYVLMLGVLFELFSGISQTLSIIIVTVISLVFLFWGGFKSDIWTNTAQFILMFLGFGILLLFSILKLGDISSMLSLLPENHLELKGNKSIQYVLSWFIISLQTFVDPSFHQRCAASKKSSTPKKGVLISIGFWILFDTLTLLTGLYAKAYFEISDPLQAYPVLAENILPVFWKGFFIVALLSVIMSTLDSYAFVSAMTIGNDILTKIRKFKNISIKKLTQIGLFITSIFSIAIAILIPSAIDIIYKTSSIAIPGLLLPVILSFSSRYTIRKKFRIIAIILPSIISFVWTIGKGLFPNYFAYFSQIEPMFPGIIFSAIISIFVIIKEG